MKTPKLLHSLYGDAVWFLPNTEHKIYLTFDDGPIAEITSKCLDILKTHNVKATFFCVGENVLENPDLLQRMREDGHEVGHHSHHHLMGWKTPNEVYFEDVNKCADLVGSNLFRPPYGKIKRSQVKELKKQFRIIMWDVLSADFDPKVPIEKCVKNVVNNTEAGSIIVMHDNEKCGTKMLASLPEIITQLKAKGFTFSPLSV